jgi:hypothetical protein
MCILGINALKSRQLSEALREEILEQGSIFSSSVSNVSFLCPPPASLAVEAFSESTPDCLPAQNHRCYLIYSPRSLS